MKTKNPREAAFLAVWNSLNDKAYASDFLKEWRLRNAPSLQDFHFAKEIAFGSIKRINSLDYLLRSGLEEQRLNIKAQAKALLYTALYQFFYMDRVPSYAVVNETVSLANKYFHNSVSKFLNAILRKLSKISVILPEGNSLRELSIRFSYPEFFVEKLIRQMGVESAISVMESGNLPIRLMARCRKLPADKQQECLPELLSDIILIKDSEVLPEIAASENYYIQNATPAELICRLSRRISPPKKILDLCASPGGKLIALHDQFPEAILFANDVSSARMQPLIENLKKYKITANLSCQDGQNYKSPERFDLIILDVPCSNSGVLSKHPEARWRINESQMQQLKALQLKLIESAGSLLSAKGEIWLMTCSILEEENERLAEEASCKFGLAIAHQISMLPNKEGWDGGFAAVLK